MSHDDRSTVNWQLLFWGAVLLLIAYYLYGTLTELEKSGGAVKVHWAIAALYKLLGKWGVVGLSGLLGLGMCWRAFVSTQSD